MQDTSNRYRDTRGNSTRSIAFTEAVVRGLAEGGGLYVPEHVPQLSLSEIEGLARLSYAQRAARVFEAFEPDLSASQIARITHASYGDNFDTPDICPITSLDNGMHILELWHGSTSAFKDLALQCLPRLFSASACALRARGLLDDRHLILVATSGDTGKAALAGFADVEGVKIAVMYPEGGVSDIQYRQMATQTGGNVMVWGVRGNFDDCQSGAKSVFSDAAFASELHATYATALSSANSINWGRLMPQIVYYLSAYAQLVQTGAVASGGPVDVCVPTGNFGNILAAYYARCMGAPIRMLLCASNENRVLADFINSGTYDIADRPFVKTPSPSMDILVSSNLERQLFELTGRDSTAIRTWMDDLRRKKAFRVDKETFARLRASFCATAVDNATCLDTIHRAFEEHGYLMDPHTAVAFRAAEELRTHDVPVLIASTAHWAKFGVDVYRGLHGIAPGEALPERVAELGDCAVNRLIAHECALGPDAIPQGLAALEDLPIRFAEIIDGAPASIEQAVRAFLHESDSDVTQR